MPKVVREDLDNLTAVLSVTIPVADYEPKFEQELQKYRKKAQIKGFRKGKTPASVAKKMFGRSILAELINDMLQNELYTYLQESGVHILGQPLPNADQEEINFELKSLHDYTFRFDIGLAPEFEVQGLDASHTYSKYAVEVPDSMVEEDWAGMLKRSGTRTSVEADEALLENDLLKLKAVELEGGAPKEDGVESEFSLLISNASEDYRSKILGLHVGDTFEANLHDLENSHDDRHVRRYFLQLDESDDREISNSFSLTILEATRIKDAEVNQDLFDQVFGPDQVHSEEEAKEKIRAEIRSYFDKQAEGLLFRDFQERLMELNNLELPDAFLQRWILASNEKATRAQVDQEYPIFAKNLRWTLIRNKIARQFDLSVSEEEIQHRFKIQIFQYFGNSPYITDEFVDSMVERMMKDEKQVERVYEDIMSDRLYDAIAGVVTIEPKAIGHEEFEAIAQAARAEAEKARMSTLIQEEEE